MYSIGQDYQIEAREVWEAAVASMAPQHRDRYETEARRG